MAEKEITLQMVLEIARAMQHVQTLEELEQLSFPTESGRIRAWHGMDAMARTWCHPRRIIALMLHAADNPDWAWVNFWAFFCPDMTVNQMASLRKISKGTVKFHLEQTELPEDAYEFIPENY